MAKRRQAVDPAVANLLTEGRQRKARRRGETPKDDLAKVTVRLPADLLGAIKAEAHDLTGHQRRGFQDLLGVLVRWGWDAYQSGALEVELQPRTVERRIVIKSEG